MSSDEQVLEHVQLEELTASAADGPLLKGNRLSLIRNVPVSVLVQLGAARMTVADLLALKPGEVVALDKGVDEPVELVLDGQVLATGKIVVAGDNFGIQITSIAELKS